MGSTAVTVSLGCNLGGGTGNWFWNHTLGAGACGAYSFETLGADWGGMGCCGLGCFIILFYTLGDQRV